MQITGKVLHKTEEQLVGKNQMPKITLVIEEEGKQYPDSIGIDFLGDKVELIDGVTVDSVVTVNYNTSCSEYNGRFYNNIKGWKIDVQSKSNNESLQDISTDDDLPF